MSDGLGLALSIVAIIVGFCLLAWAGMAWECSNFERDYDAVELRMPSGCFVEIDGEWWHIKQVDRELGALR